ncbi:UTP--glucose-1-phosphate uridylyltransferase [Acholeplasma morum]|jgi:UTP--glucose-1-phosphate uridylyltransferase|uniref:UTP--glucose-1-phosphate uridylyltransferase GalU n=1 Tax=Paracholeplasma morum TaxID=264637 RepID=UPI00195852A1|nr:UTP--glucose-1-phosphate uridylyltransferase GalU [Paracholeplasma morum]MBM7453239.1 UTP--glucose-1-phosphate uridylyltransferase [Paracholeplasma morum]
MIKKAVIPAAGYGTRFLPATKALAKEMFPIIDTPTIQYIVEEAIASGIEEILIIVSANKNAIMDHFDRNLELEGILKEKNKTEELNIVTRVSNLANIHYIRQKEQLGLGHAVLCAKAFIGNEPFALLLGDDLYVGNEKPVLRQLIDKYDQYGGSFLGTLEVDLQDTSKYGICKPESVLEPGLSLLSSVVEKPKPEVAPSRSAIGGRYVLSPTIFKYLENQERGAGGEIQLTDAIKRMMTEEKVFSYDVDGKRYDIGSRIGYIEATLDFGLKRDDVRPQVIELLNKKLKELDQK